MFQKEIATARFLLIVAGAFATLIWLLDGPQGGGLWPVVRWLASLGVCLASAYLMAELNSTFALLRISSRTISTLWLLLLTCVPGLHSLSPAHLVVMAAPVAYFPLLHSYQRPRLTFHSFLLFLTLSVASLACPQLLLMVPLLWVSQIIMRSMSLKGFVASLLGIVVPYFLLFTFLYCTDRVAIFPDGMGDFCNSLEKIGAENNDALMAENPALCALLRFLRIGLPCYAGITLQQVIVLALALVLFAVGTHDFVQNKHLDKTRTRQAYYCIVSHGVFALLWLALQPQHIGALLPLFLAPTAIVGGHFLALSYGKWQNIFCIALICLLFLAALFTLFPPIHF